MVKNNSRDLTVCAKCGRYIEVIQCVTAPSNSRYAGRHICVRCIDAPISQGNMMRPTEIKFPVGGSGASI